MSATVVPLPDKCNRCNASADDFCAQCGAALCPECAAAWVWCSRCEGRITADGRAWETALPKTWRLDFDAPCYYYDEAPSTRALPCCGTTVCEEHYTPSACGSC